MNLLRYDTTVVKRLWYKILLVKFLSQRILLFISNEHSDSQPVPRRPKVVRTVQKSETLEETLLNDSTTYRPYVYLVWF